MCVTLNEGYQRAANRGSKNLYGFFNQNKTYQPSMKRRIFLVCLFTVFLRLQIYEVIAAIFWQSASYVCFFTPSRLKFVVFTHFLKTGILKPKSRNQNFISQWKDTSKTPRSRKISVLVSKAVNKTSTFSNFRDPFLKC